jgi:Flp pilus assembly pilin Flp
VHHGVHQVQVQSFSEELTGGLEERDMSKLMRRLWSEDSGQDIAEYAVMLAVILVLVVGTVRLIGSNSNTVFSNVASSIQ